MQNLERVILNDGDNFSVNRGYDLLYGVMLCDQRLYTRN